MKRSCTYLSFILGLLISFPIVFQSYHAIEHHILEDVYQVRCSDHDHEHLYSNKSESTSSFDYEAELCPICEYKIVCFLNEKLILQEQEFVFLHDFKTPILNHPLVQVRDCKNKLRGPPII